MQHKPLKLYSYATPSAAGRVHLILLSPHRASHTSSQPIHTNTGNRRRKVRLNMANINQPQQTNNASLFTARTCTYTFSAFPAAFLCLFVQGSSMQDACVCVCVRILAIRSTRLSLADDARDFFFLFLFFLIFIPMRQLGAPMTMDTTMGKFQASSARDCCVHGWISAPSFGIYLRSPLSSQRLIQEITLKFQREAVWQY